MSHLETIRVSLIRRKAVQDQTGLARSTLYKLISTGDFPAPVKITSKAVAWRSSAIDAWVATRIATKTN